jgi:starch synthase (maltosyl-transferring)
LPVTAIGRDGNKGTLGSPYAIRNPYLLDERLAEPFHGLGVEAEFAAFVEAAHRLGMRVVMEFVFRTAAKDSDWVQEHPDWFYWIDESIPDRDPSSMTAEGYGNPRFNEEELNIIKMRVRRNDAAGLPPPGMAYRQMFQDPPNEVIREGDGYIGISNDGKRLRIPGAFADWPPDDIQPPWNDVTYLKLYDHPSFNYIAYNTIRMYDSRLAIAENENRGLWNTVLNIIPHYQKRFGIDGVMIDMGHALPRRLKQTMVERSRKNDPGFAFWEENFSISARSRQEGYNAAVGYLWADQHLPAKLHEFLRLISDSDVPIPFFATAETHNTPRAAARPGGIRFSRLSFAINAFLPAVLFIHQGFELGETFPVNTGLGFSHGDLIALPSHTLPLFSHSALCWNNHEEFSDYVSRVISIRYRYTGMLTDARARTTHVVDSGDSSILCFTRCTHNGATALAIVANLDCHADRTAVLSLETPAAELSDLLTDERFASDGTRFTIALDAGQVRVFELRTDSPAADA